MPQLLLELFSEEIPARMQKRAEEDLARALGDRLKAAGVEAKAIKTFSTPRRLGAVIDDLPAKAADVNEEKKGPRVGAPDAAIQGFLKSAGLASIEQAQVVQDKKGDFYVARIERTGRATHVIVQEIVPEIVRAFPWPKSMRSGSSDLQWVRPLHNVLCLFGGAHVRIEIDGVGSEPATWGHRFHAPAAIMPKDFADYSSKLRAAKVEIDREARKALILERARALCAARKLELVEDAGLLEEVAGLAEWPVVLMGDMDPAFLDLPAEVVRLSMRTHQKYFAVRGAGGKLAPHFVTVANVEAKDGGKAIAAGNARVLSARLNDARFFWDTDRKTPLFTEARREKLKAIVFHQKLGSVWDKVERVKALAAELCAVTGADRGLVERAAELCKMDLVTETVGEFPELQGQIGRALAEQQRTFSLAEKVAAERPDEGRADKPPSDRLNAPHPPTPSPQGRGGEAREHLSVAAAIEDHYRPLGPNDRVPSDPVAVTLALADKLDTLVGFWAIDERPTGSNDPYALRRAALGVVRILLIAKARIGLRGVLRDHYEPELVKASQGFGLRFEGFHDLSRLPEDSEGGHLINELRGDYGAFCFTFDGLLQANEPLVLLLKKEAEEPPEEYFDAVQLLAVRAGALERYSDAVRGLPSEDGLIVLSEGSKIQLDSLAAQAARRRYDAAAVEMEPIFNSFSESLLTFLADRLKVQLRDQGKRHDLVDAVFALGDDDLVRIVARVEALDAFLKTEDGANLLAGYKRAANILAAEEKKGKGLSEADLVAGLDAKLLTDAGEKALYAALEKALPAARAAVEKEEFGAAMKALADLRAPVDAFFEQVLVNAENAAVRRNRLLLLARLREALAAVADFSKVEG